MLPGKLLSPPKPPIRLAPSSSAASLRLPCRVSVSSIEPVRVRLPLMVWLPANTLDASCCANKEEPSPPNVAALTLVKAEPSPEKDVAVTPPAMFSPAAVWERMELPIVCLPVQSGRKLTAPVPKTVGGGPEGALSALAAGASGAGAWETCAAALCGCPVPAAAPLFCWLMAGQVKHTERRTVVSTDRRTARRIVCFFTLPPSRRRAVGKDKGRERKRNRLKPRRPAFTACRPGSPEFPS